MQTRGLELRGRVRPFGGARPTRADARASVATLAAKKDLLLRSLSDLGEVAVLVADATNLVQEAATRHKTQPTATAALGRTLVGSMLMGVFRKEEEMIQVTFRGDGPIGQIMALADTRGNVKGKVTDPSADPPLREDGKLNVGAAVGAGVLAIVRSHPQQPQPYTGMVPIVSGEVAEDLANYLVDSEQTNSALGLGVSITRDCTVKSAGGFLVQVLPFCSEETLAQLEQNLSGLPSVTNMLNQGMTPQDITDRILAGLGVSPGQQGIEPRYGPCDEEPLKGRMMRAVASLGKAEVQDIMRTEGKIEVTCEFCMQTYQFQEQDVLALIEQRTVDAL